MLLMFLMVNVIKFDDAKVQIIFETTKYFDNYFH